MITPQTNITLAEMAERLKAFSSFAICGHVNPDGDCLGSELALAHALKSQGKSVVCLLAKPEPIPHNLKFLPGSEWLVYPDSCTETPECFIGVDVPTADRLGEAAEVLKKASASFTIDHHASETTYAEQVYVDPDSPSASMIVWELVSKMSAQSKEAAQCALTGVITDTGRFAHQNTTPGAFLAAASMMEQGADPTIIAREFFQNRRVQSIRLEQVMFSHMRLSQNGTFAHSWLSNADFAECDAVKADAEPFIDSLRDIEGVRVALILKENSDGTVRGSLRAKDSTNVAQIAKHYGGGGHVAAAGFTYKGSLEDAVHEVPGFVCSTCFGGKAH